MELKMEGKPANMSSHAKSSPQKAGQLKLDERSKITMRRRMKDIYESAFEEFYFSRVENPQQPKMTDLKAELSKLDDPQSSEMTSSHDGVPCFMLKHDYDLENLVCDKVDLEFLNPSDVLIDVHYVGINFSDLYSIKGLFYKKKLPYIPGVECSGIVLATGSEVPLFKKGDMVMVFNPEGGLLKDKVVVSKNCVFHCPDLIKGAAIPVNYLTSMEIIYTSDLLQSFESGGMTESSKRKKKVLFHNCGGGVGSAFYDLTKHMDIKHLGTCSRAKRSSVPYESYEYKNWDSEVKYKHPEGIDMVIETISGPNTKKSLDILRHHGSIHIIGASAILNDDPKLEEGAFISVEKLIMKNLSAIGVNVQTLFHEKPQYVRKVMDFVVTLLSQKLIDPSIGGIFQFDEVVDAFKYMLNRKNIGKVLVQIKIQKPKVRSMKSDQDQAAF